MNSAAIRLRGVERLALPRRGTVQRLPGGFGRLGRLALHDQTDGQGRLRAADRGREGHLVVAPGKPAAAAPAASLTPG
jgi:hypothetical protein